MTAENTITVLVTRYGMGTCEPELSIKLFNAYCDLLLANDKLPECVCFYAEGVKLAVEGSPVLEVLKSLENKGVKLASCGTCLNHYDLSDKLKVGSIGNMQDLIDNQWKSGKVITI